MGAGDTHRFALFARETAATTNLLHKFGDLLDPKIRPPLHDEAIWLVRPDGYVACSASDADPVDRWLSQIARPSA